MKAIRFGLSKRILGIHPRRNACVAILLAAGVAITTVHLAAQPQGGNALTPQVIAARNATEKELESIAIIERKVMVPMRDGKRMATDVYRPKDTSKKYPVIFVRTPYNFNYWDVKNGLLRHPGTAADGRLRCHLVDG
jgi:uncharacterized protein